MKKMKRFVALALAWVMAFSVIPADMTVHAAQLVQATEETAAAEAVAEETAQAGTAEAPETAEETTQEETMAPDTEKSAEDAEESLKSAEELEEIPEEVAETTEEVSAEVPELADEVTAEESDYTYTIMNGSYCVINGYSGTETELVLPATLGGYSVQKLADSAFRNNTALKSVTFPTDLETMGTYVFAGCTSLETVTFNDSFKEIGKAAFLECTSLTKLVFSASMETVGQSAFEGCTGLTSVSFPENLTTLENQAFAGCTALTEVKLPEGLTSIGSFAFNGDTSLTSIVLPDSVTSIGYEAFLNCTELTSINYPKSFTTCSSYNYYTASIFKGCSKLTGIEVPEGVTSIPDNAFMGCDYLETIELPSTLESIGEAAFLGCVKLHDIELPESLTSLGQRVFYGCTALEEIHIPGGIGSVLSQSFYDCSSLVKVTVGEGITTIGENAFANCTALTDVTLPEGLTTLGHWAFSGVTALESLILPDSVTTMGYRVFLNDTALASINYPKSWETCTTYNYYSGDIFRGCTSLTNIEIPEGVTAVPTNAFYYADGLEEVKLPSTLTSIGNSAFRYCTSLKKLECNAGLKSIGDYGFADCTGLTEVVFNETLETLGSQAFYQCTGLREISLPGSIATISYQAFYRCTGLTKVTVGEGTTAIGQSAFEECAGVTSYSLPEGLTSIGNFAFVGNTSLTGIKLPNSVTSIGYRAFHACTKLKSLNFPASFTTCTAHNYYSGQIVNGCTELKTIEIPEGVTAIPAGAFAYSCLKQVILPESLTTIGDSAFAYSSSLERIWIDKNVTTIGNGAFTSCAALTIHGVADSYAQEYAEANSIPFSTEPLVYAKSTLSGTVTDETGKGVSGIYVSLYDETEGELQETVLSDAAGAWSCDQVLVGHVYHVFFYHEDYVIADCRQTFTITDAVQTAKTVTANAKTELAETAEENFTYTVLNGTYCELTGYTGTDAEVRIPETLGGYKVQSIADSAFYGNTTLTRVVLPETVETMGSDVFRNCTQLRDVSLNHGLTNIGVRAFYGCTSLNGIVLPGTVTGIGQSAFELCTALTDVTLPEGLTSIDYYAFAQDSALETLVLPDSLSVISYQAFRDCTALSSVNYPKSWSSCPVYNYHYGEVFRGCTALTKLEIPEGVTSIPANALRGCNTLAEVTLPSTLTSIGGGAFAGATALTEIEVPESVKTLGESAFENCTSLVGGIFHEGLESMGSRAFYGCTALGEISLPGSLAALPESGFRECTSLTKVTLAEGTTAIGENTFANCTALTDVALPEGLTTLGHWAFSGATALESLTLPDSVTTMGYRVFLNDTALTSINYPKSWAACTAYNYYSGEIFRGCTSLTSIEIPEGVTAIPTNAFYYADGLEEVKLPSTLTSIGDSAFRYCTSLKKLECNAGLKSIGNYGFADCTGLTEVVFNETLETLGSQAFYQCIGLREISLPGSLDTISYQAFLRCTGLTKVTVGQGTTAIGQSAFEECTGVTSYSLPESLTSIGNYAFVGNTSLTGIKLPNSVTSMGYRAFSGCTKLKDVNFPTSFTTCTAYNYYSGQIFNGCTLFQKLQVPEGAATIPAGAFAYSSLEMVILPESLTTIGDSAFAYSSSLEKIWIDKNVTTIGNGAFTSCAALTIHGVADSYAQEYAEANSIPFSTEPLSFETTSLEGCVKDAGGNGVAGIYVTLYDMTAKAAQETLLTDENGNYNSFEVLVGHTYRVYFFHEDYVIDNPMQEFAVTGDAILAADVLVKAKEELEVTAEENFTYTVLNGTYCELTGYTGSAAQISIPETLGGYKVQSIAAGTFQYNTTLERVVLPDTVETIGKDAFRGCTGLKDVSLNHGLTSIGISAFVGCTALTGFVLPSTVESIGAYAFEKCTGLTKLTFAEGLKTIGNYAFDGDTGLVSVTLPDSVETMGYRVFLNCTGLTSINYPMNWTTCTAYNYYYGDIFKGCTSLKNYVIPEGVTAIPAHALQGCETLAAITLPSTLESIGDYAFYGCSSLGTIGCGEALRSVGEYAFGTCTGLASVSLKEGLATLGSHAFYRCSSLGEIELPGTLTVIGASAFRECTGLTKVTIAEGAATIDTSAFEDCTALVEVSLPEGLTTIGNFAFKGASALTAVVLPDSVTAMGYQSFMNCTSLETINYPKSWNTCTKYNYYYGDIFRGCTKLTKLEIPEGVTAIPDYALQGCDSLQEVVLPSTLTAIGKQAFYGCSSLKTLELGTGLASIGEAAFQSCTKLERISFSEGLESMGKNAFYGCTSIKELSLPASLGSISENAFRSCTGLTKITVAKGIISIGTAAFEDCTALKTVSLPDGLTNVGNFAFKGCTGLTSFTLPDCVTTIGYQAFMNCTALSEVNYPKSFTSCSAYNYYYGDIFRGCTALAKLEIPEGVTAIPSRALSGCDTLEEVVLPSTLTSMGDRAFYNCSKLKKINLVEGLTEIPEYAFYGCDNVEWHVLTMPSTLETIGSHAFYNCIGFRELHFNENLKSIGEYAFYGCDGLVGFELNDGLETLSKAAFGDCINLKSAIVPKSVIAMAEQSFVNYTKEKLMIYCYANSTAHLVCEAVSYPYTLIDDHTHTYQTETEEEPSCVEDGIYIHTCTICGYTYASVQPAPGHTWNEWKVKTEATVLQEGEKSRGCEECETLEVVCTEKVQVDITTNQAYGLVHFTIVDASTKTPISGASVHISTETEGEATLFTDEEGKLSQVLPVGQVTISVYTEGYQVRTIPLIVTPGETELPMLGISTSNLVEGKLTHREMTLQEMIDAGIDVNDESNKHTYKYALNLQFRPEIDLLSLMYYMLPNGMPCMLGVGFGGIGGEDGEGGGEGNGSASGSRNGIDWETLYQNGQDGKRYGIGFRFTFEDGETASVYPVNEMFYLIIYGEAHWVKEMYDVELLVINNSMTDWVEDAQAELYLPEGLSLAKMSEEVGQQTLLQNIGRIDEGESTSVHWYVRGDVEGEYDLTAALRGKMKPFGDSFEYIYEADSPLKVYAGSAMHLTFYVPNSAFPEQEYTVRIELQNVSTKTLYKVSHSITDIEQYKIVMYSDGHSERVDYTASGGVGTIYVEEFHPGDKLVLETSTAIQFESEIIHEQLDKVSDGIDAFRSLSEGFKAVSTGLELLDSLIDAGSKISGNLDGAIKSGDFDSKEKQEAANKLLKQLNSLLSKCTDGTDSEALKAISKLKGSKTWDTITKISDDPTILNTWSAAEIAVFTSQISLVNAEAGFESDTEGGFDPFESVQAALSLIPIRFVLVNSWVSTLEGSTTVIPSSIRVTNVGANYFGVENVSKYLYSLIVACYGESVSTPEVLKALGFDAQEAMGYYEAVEYVKAVEEEAALFHAATASGTGRFRAWYEPAARAIGDYELTVDNETAQMIDDKLTFEGSGLISLTPHGSVSGTLYVETPAGDVKTYKVGVVEQHDCESHAQWQTVIPAMDGMDGMQAKCCSICDDIVEVRNVSACAEHSYGEYVLEQAPTLSAAGMEKRVCSVCGNEDCRFIDAYAADGYIRGFEVGTTAEQVMAYFENLNQTVVFAEETDLNAPLATGTTVICEGETYEMVITGDLNGDAKLDIFDVYAAMDSRDDTVSQDDILELIDRINGVDSELPKETMTTESTDENYRVTAVLSEETPVIGDTFTLTLGLAGSEAAKAVRGVQMDLTGLGTEVLRVISKDSLASGANALSNQMSLQQEGDLGRYLYVGAADTVLSDTGVLAKLTLQINPELKTGDVLELPVVYRVEAEDGSHTFTDVVRIAYKPVDVEIPVEELELDAKTLTLLKGDKETLEVTCTPENANMYTSVKWTSSDETVATVEQGVLTAVGTGVAEVTASTANGCSAVCKVVVTGLNYEELIISPDESKILALSDADLNEEVVWKTDDETVAFVDENGTVTGIGVGETIITAALADGRELTCSVLVSDELVRITLNRQNKILYIYGTDALTVTFAPEGKATNVTWTSSNTDVVQVRRGKVQAVGAGTAVVTAAAYNESGEKLTAACIYHVVDRELIDETYRVHAITNVDGTLADLNDQLPEGWTWEDPGIKLSTFAGIMSKEFAVNLTEGGESLYTSKVTVDFTTIDGIEVNGIPAKLATGVAYAAAAEATYTITGSDLGERAGELGLQWRFSIVPKAKTDIVALEQVEGKENAVKLEGLKAGSTKILTELVTEDGAVLFKKTQSISVISSEKGIAQVDISLVDAEGMPVAMENGAYLVESGEDVYLKDNTNLKPDGKAYTIKYSTSDAKVAKSGKALKADKTMVALVTDKPGTAVITAVSNDALKSAMTLRIKVEDHTANGISISQRTVTINRAKTEAEAELTVYNGYGAKLENVVVTSDKKGLQETDAFAATIVDEVSGTVKISLDASVKTKNVYLRITTEDMTGEPAVLPLTVKVVNTKPSITVKQVSKVNTFYADACGIMTVGAAGEVIRDVIILESDAGYAYDYETGKVTVSDPEKLSKKKVTLSIEVEGYAEPIEKKVTIGTETLSLGLSAASGTVYTGTDNLRVTLRLMDKKAKKALDLDGAFVEVTDKKGNPVDVDAWCVGETIVLSVDEAPVKAQSLKLTLSDGNWNETRTFGFTLKSAKASAAKLSLEASTLNLYQYQEGDGTCSSGTYLTLSGSNPARMLEQVEVTGANAKAQALLDTRSLSVEYDAGTGKVTATLRGKTVAAGSYKFTLSLADETLSKPIKTTLTVKITNVADLSKCIKVSAKGSIDVLRRDTTSVTLAATLKNVPADAEVSDIRLVGRDAHLFEEPVLSGKTATVQLKDDANVITKYNYQVSAVYTVECGSETLELEGAPVKIKLTQGKSKVTAAGPGAYSNVVGESLPVTFTAADSVGERIEIEDVKLSNFTKDFSYDAETGALTHVSNGETARDKTYSLKFTVYLKGRGDNEKPITVVYKVKIS